jgi:hypothetical protein
MPDHGEDEECNDEKCQQCCPHDWDDYCCLICGVEKDWGAMIDAVMDDMKYKD